MVDSVRPAASVARFGFTSEHSVDELRAAGWWSGNGPAPGAEAVVTALSHTPDPDLALRTVDRIRQADPDTWTRLAAAIADDEVVRGRLFGVAGTSTALGDFLVSAPAEWRRLQDPTPRTKYGAALQQAVAPGGAPLAGSAAEQALRKGYRGLLLEIAADDLGHLVEDRIPEPTFADTAQALTDLADAALRAGLSVAEYETRGAENATLAVIAMGKCGGGELNYVSDVDVVFVGDGDLDVGTRLASAMMRVVGKACFEVDAALRPEGKAGALVRTLDSHEAYYKKWARTWEFQALLKARPAAGDAELGRRYAELVAPMVWSAAERDNFVTDVQHMRRRVEKHIPADIADRELKLGRGGLRDVEFAVQLLQLVHGRVDPQLRSGSTLNALDALGSGGYVGRTDAAEMQESYEFLRLLEHRLQLRALRRTHLFPEADDTAALRWLARAVGIRQSRSKSVAESLLQEFRKHVRHVRTLHEKLFYRPLLDAVARVPSADLRLTAKQASQRLTALGFASPDGALQHIRTLTAGVSRRAAIQQTLLPVLLDLLADTPEPDGGLLAYRRVSEALAETPWYLRVLRDEAEVAENLATLLGTSRLVPDLLVRAPEVLRMLGDADRLCGRDPAETATSLRAAARRQPGMNAAVATARSLRRHEMLRVACADILGLLDVPSVCDALSSVWVAVLQAALEAATRYQQAQIGGQPAKLAVIGMGRLGGGELGYGSDADVMFVCERAGDATDAEALKFATTVAETLRSVLGAPTQDPALEVDAELRPEGRSGPLVRTFESYRAYYERWGEVWESQALLRARFLAGDDDLGERFIAAIDPVRYPEGGLDATKVREVRRIKARVDTERMPRGADPTMHTKLGRGGLADVEWTAQLAQLRYAHEVPALRTTSTPGALEAMGEAGLAERDEVEALRESWLLATKARNAAMLVRGKAVDQLPASGRELTAVASIFGHGVDDDAGEFLDAYRKTTRQAHAVVERLFYDA
ncbi:bifunctional glutamine-synthetase adenylyltransferase/deadenyltransferase [Saccharomonospora sp. CUA-673]|uniref:bifunctional [glutamine synthetase] adenylyltransferase/[glutamine synthetase]-adenylyl-L-tyrosine phosphorylase n=1 Tax=Saccharomonospora sp. CUA-673 TaxID=1904969 RepID=UPI00096532C9|nr:bifunctional [glutamine synthetase] adenylyltransferase/[glutamine synthetase]-adenylyl-L-tyrosine phosphorylase [Saccharomonospora sp. CUA-673]OLT46577.1 bifunctional glutamine-synthetase adenylyltransferase/deadenyltransferase [Saccharomonospora sp. CUA-673]